MSTQRNFLTRLTSPIGLLLSGLALQFIHLFWYGSVWTAWLAFVCYAPLLTWLRLHSKRPFLAGYTFGLWYALMNVYWLGQFVGKWTSSAFIGAIAVFAVGSIWGCCYGLGVWLWKKYPAEKFGFVLMSGLLLWLPDIGRNYIPQFEFPFTPYGEPLVAYPAFVQFLPHCYGLSLLIALTNLCISFGRKFQRLSVITSIAVSVILVAVHGVMNKAPRPLSQTKIALGQLGFDLAYMEEGLKPFKVREAINDLSRRARVRGADVLILPEAVASFATQPNTVFDLPPDLNVLFGAQRGVSPRYQSAFLWNGKTFQFTDKTRLVVFGEYVPFRDILPYPKGFQLPSGDLAPGKAQILPLPNGLKIGTMICFESLFPSAAKNLQSKGADILSIISLDDWYMGTNAIPRLEIAAQWRAVETGKWIFRVGSLGKTMVIDPTGRIRAKLPIGERELLIYDL